MMQEPENQKNVINANKFAENQRYNIEGDESYNVKDLARIVGKWEQFIKC